MTGLELDLADFAAEVAAITGHFANRIGVER